MKGKEGIPVFKSPDKKLRLSFEASKDIFSFDGGSERPIFNEKDKKFSLIAPKSSYFPLHVMKCLYKIGYSLLFDDEIADYSPTHKIIMSEEFDTLLPGGGHLAKI